jgi:hypothetical protein
MRPTKESGLLLKEYVKLARKLGKLPTRTETERYLCSERQIRNYFNNLTNLQTLALKQVPEFSRTKIKAEPGLEKRIIYKTLGVNSEK